MPDSPGSTNAQHVMAFLVNYIFRNNDFIFLNSHEDIPNVQCKRNPSKTVGSERGHQGADRLKPKSQKTSQSDHMDHSLV